MVLKKQVLWDKVMVCARLYLGSLESSYLSGHPKLSACMRYVLDNRLELLLNN